MRTESRRSLVGQFTFVMFVFFFFVSVVQGKTISGVLTKIDKGAIEVRMNKQKTQPVTLNDETTYGRRLMYRRAGDRHADFSSLVVGMNIRVELRSDNTMVAKKVWIIVR